jgi:hypothetical protein
MNLEIRKSGNAFVQIADFVASWLPNSLCFGAPIARMDRCENAQPRISLCALPMFHRALAVIFSARLRG